MAQVMVNFRLDENLKKEMEQVCKDIGITMSAAFTIFVVKVTKEKKIPFELSAVSNKEDKQIQRFMTYMEKLLQEKERQAGLSELFDQLGIRESETDADL